MNRRIVVAVLLFLLAAQIAWAQIPRTISYQGVLTDAGGTVVADGNYNTSLRLYDVPAGGVYVWEEGQSVAVTKGVFNVILGSVTPLGIPFDKPYWLGVRIAGGSELTPRLALTSSAYSFNAMSVEDNAITSSKIAPGPADGLVLTTSGGKVVWQTPTGGGVILPYSGTTSSSSAGFSVNNTGIGHGVSGTSSGGVGVRGESSAGIGVGGKSTSGIGVAGQSTSYAGVYGSSGSGDAVGGESSSGNGVSGKSSSGSGVVGTNTTSGNYGELGTSGYGVHAVGFGSTTGVFAQSTSGDAVSGASTGSTKSGVYGLNDKSDGYGVYGQNSSTGNFGYIGGKYGVYGESSSDAGVYGSSTSSYGVFGWSSTYNGVTGSSVSGTAVYCAGKFYQSGGVFEAHPTSTNWSTNKPATVKLNNGTKVKLFAEEAAEVYFTDYGEGRLVQGRAHIELDPIFQQTVTIDALHPIMAFVQLEEDCRGVFVTNKTTTGFDVVEQQSGTSNARFAYRIICKRKYYEDERLATEQEDVSCNTRMLQKAWPEIISQQQADLGKMK